jgi:hypothetical protein
MSHVQDDSRKYPSKESAAFLPGMTGGFQGGELGIQQFTAYGSLNLADEDIVRKRHVNKDVALVVGVAALITAAGYGLQQAGVVDFSVLASGGTATELSGTAVDSVPVHVTMPMVALTTTQQTALAAAGITTGSVLLFVAMRDAAVSFVTSVGGSVAKNGARVAVLVVAGAVARELLLH